MALSYGSMSVQPSALAKRAAMAAPLREYILGAAGSGEGGGSGPAGVRAGGAGEKPQKRKEAARQQRRGDAVQLVSSFEFCGRTRRVRCARACAREVSGAGSCLRPRAWRNVSDSVRAFSRTRRVRCAHSPRWRLRPRACLRLRSIYSSRLDYKGWKRNHPGV